MRQVDWPAVAATFRAIHAALLAAGGVFPSNTRMADGQRPVNSLFARTLRLGWRPGGPAGGPAGDPSGSLDPMARRMARAAWADVTWPAREPAAERPHHGDGVARLVARLVARVVLRWWGIAQAMPQRSYMLQGS